MDGPQALAHARHKYVEGLHRPHRGTSKRYSSLKVIHDILKGTLARARATGRLKRRPQTRMAHGRAQIHYGDVMNGFTGRIVEFPFHVYARAHE